MALILHQISDIYQESGHIDSAYYYLTLHDQLRTRLSNNSKTIEVYQEYISLSLESAKNELTIAEQAMTIRNKQLMVVIILAVGVILVITLLLIIMQQKKRSMLKRMEHEKQIQTLQKEKITLQKNELEMQVREITSYSVLLSNKNHTLQQIEGLLQQLLASDKNNEEKICKEINTIIKNNLNSDSERQSFMLHFGKVHPRFFEKLKNYCDDLTENNLHLCAYFRIGMSSKQIAQIMNVSFDTIRSNRYRLRKKLGLQEEEDLYDFLRKI